MVSTRAAIGLALWCAAGAAAAETYAWPRSVQGYTPPGWVDPKTQAGLGRAAEAQAAGRYAEAAAAGERALQALEAAPGVAPRELARCLVWLGEVQWLAGDLARAELLLKRGLATLETALGTSHPEVAAARNKLGAVYQSEGLPGRAEPLHQRALSMQRAVLGPDHLDVATSLDALAILYGGQGQHERARPFFERALAIREKALGPNHADVASSLANLAALREAEGEHDQAEALLRRALAIQRKALGERHPDVAASLDQLAAVSLARRRPGEAEPLARRALEIRQAALGEGHPDVAASLGALAAMALARGAPGEAEPLARRALAVREKALGEVHPEVAASLQLLARIQLAQGSLDGALPLLWRSLALSEARLRREALDFSEQRLAAFLQVLRAEEERLYALVRAHPDDARVQRLGLAAALLRKGRSAEEVANTSRAVYRSLDLPDRDAFERLRGLRSELARRSMEGAGTAGPAAYQRRLRELAEQGDALEARLVRRSSRLRALAALPSPDEIVDRVAGALPADGALVELVAYAEPEGELRYLALVLAPGGRTRAADLGPAKAVDEAVARLRDALASRGAEYLERARAAEALVFEPLRPLLGGARRISVSPDGQLALVPFAALHDGRGFLMDSYDFTYLTSGKDLLPAGAGARRSRSVVVLAAPDFAARVGGPTAGADPRTPAERAYSLAPSRGSAPRVELAGANWAPLPGTRLEAEALRGLFPEAQVFVGPEATKERLLHVAAPGILHVATHGFFLEDAAAPAGSRGLGITGALDGGPLPPQVDPLLRSGLVLAGAGSGKAGGEVPLDRSLVTALELAGVDLWGTQLVVLSACDTGRGDVQLGQGVYGLRRALAAAGAETVVMSLWKVDDETTHALMERYYGGLLAGQGRTAALRGAMQALRESHPHPYFWAPFISSGKDAPLALGSEAWP